MSRSSQSSQRSFRDSLEEALHSMLDQDDDGDCIGELFLSMVSRLCFTRVGRSARRVPLPVVGLNAVAGAPYKYDKLNICRPPATSAVLHVSCAGPDHTPSSCQMFSSHPPTSASSPQTRTPKSSSSTGRMASNFTDTYKSTVVRPHCPASGSPHTH